ncbi:protein phosphatase 2C domain-containing protein [Sorangium sp. So ce1014]|uniref:protein phosphatase 2C domain-containing protein n=1 Tax=Sorangium sp. So ce1014 TaxID=3133326 RepID=UPI003F63139D
MMPPTESSPHLKIEFAQASDAGRDPNKQVNEDACGYAETRFGHLCVLCDGMGGHYGGSEASRTAIQTLFEVIEQTPAAIDPRAALKAAIEEAGRRVYQLGGPAENRVRPGSTVVAMVLHGGGVDVAHVGDSRAYVIRRQQIYPLTRDHSMVQGMVDAGMITEAQAIGHPDANKITRALGMKPEVEVEVRPEPMELYPGDVLIQASDGLTDLVLSGDILGCTRQALASGSIDHACRMLVQLANHRGGHDNITVQMVRVIETGSRSLTIAHGPPGAGGDGDGVDQARASGPQETVAMTRLEGAASVPQSAADALLAHGHGAPAPGVATAGSAPAAGPASPSNATTVIPTGTTGAPALHPASASDAMTVIPTGTTGTPARRPGSTSRATTADPTAADGATALASMAAGGATAAAATAIHGVLAVTPTATDVVPALTPTATDNPPTVAPAPAHRASALRPTTVDSAPAVRPTAADHVPAVAPTIAHGAPAVRPTAADSAPAVSPTAMDSVHPLPTTVPGGPAPMPHAFAPDARAVLSPLPLSAPAAPAPHPMVHGAPPHPGAFGAPPHPGAAYGAQPPPGAFGAPAHPGAALGPPGAAYGAQPPPGAFGAPPHPGAVYGAQPPPGAFGAPAHPGAPPHPGAVFGPQPHPGAFGAPPHPGAAFGPPPHPIDQDAPPASVAFSGHHAAAPGGPPAAAAPHLAPAPPHAPGYAATGPRALPAPSFSGPVSSSMASGVPSTVRASRGVYIALIASISLVIVVLVALLIWKLAPG